MHVFTRSRVELLNLLSSQIGTSLENVMLLKAQIEANEQVRLHAEKVEQYRRQLEEFIDVVCHEIRNPLNGIYGNVDVLKSSIIKMEKLLSDIKNNNMNESQMNEIFQALNHEIETFKEVEQTISDCAHHQKVIVDDVLNLSKLEAGQTQLVYNWTDVKVLVSQVLKMFESNIVSKPLQLSSTFASNLNNNEGEIPNKILIDPERVKQVLINLVSNSIKFTAAGHIKIEVLVFIHNDDDKVNNDNDVQNRGTTTEEKSQDLIEKNHYLKITVVDTGEGMTPEEQGRLF